MKAILCVVLGAVLLIALSCSLVWAQATAQISGTARDQSGAVLPGVEIHVTQTDTGITRDTVTNESGLYVLPNLPIGPYRLEASLPGFRTYTQTGIVLQVNSTPAINVILQVGQVSEQVEVQANAGLVETRSLSVGQVMETSRIMELPLNGRNAQELVLLQGGAAQFAPPGGQSFPGRLIIASAGSLGTSTEYTLDGIRHVDALDGLPMLLPFPDALAEFKTEIGGMSASQYKGTQVSAVTKSGTNDFHGDLFEFVRNDLFNARNYFATKNSTLKRNQFGGTAGGPIIKNKLFFFGGYQGTTLRQDPSDTRQFVPTAAMLAGDFTAFTAPVCNAGRQITLKAGFVNNRIDPALFSPAALKIAARLPKTDSPCGEVIYGKRSIENNGQFVGKIDYQLSAKHSLFGRYSYATYDSPQQYKLGPQNDNVLRVDARNWAESHAFTLGSTYLISSNTVNSARLSFTRNRRNTGTIETFQAEDVGIDVYSGYNPHTIFINVTSGFSLSSNPLSHGSDLYQLSDDVSMTRGTHQFGFGGRVAQARGVAHSTGASQPNFTFNGSVTGAGLADFLLGKLDFAAGGYTVSFTRAHYVSLYAQDTWQLKPRLNFSYGLRWSPVLPLVNYLRPVAGVTNFDIDRYRQGLRSTMFVNAPPGIFFPGDAGFAQNNNGADPANPQSDLWNPKWNQFGPRLGLAWDVEGNGRTSIRASYGLSYEESVLQYRLGSQTAQPPTGGQTRILQPIGGLDNPWLGVPGGNPFPLQVNKNMPFVPFGEYLPNLPDITPTYTQSWNLSFQREVGQGTLLSLSYLGTEITHLQAATPLNMAIFVPGVGDASGNCFLNGKITHFKVTPGTACSTVTNTQDRRTLSFVNPAFANEIGRMSNIINGGTQSYNGMLVSVQHRPSQGINLNANYTLSHCIGDYMGRQNSGYGTSVDHTYQDPNNRKRDRGNCEVDQRHAFNLTAVAETPKFVNRTLSLMASGWRLSGIYRAGSGGNLQNTLNPTTGIRTVTLGAASSSQNQAAGVDRCLCDISGQRPDLVLPNAVYLDRSGRANTQWLNPAAFAVPALGTIGNIGRANLTLPRVWQFDLSLSRVFRFRESQNLEFRVEAYNVLNRFRPGIIDTNFSAANFGKIRTALDPRIMQFALKYIF